MKYAVIVLGKGKYIQAYKHYCSQLPQRPLLVVFSYKKHATSADGFEYAQLPKKGAFSFITQYIIDNNYSVLGVINRTDETESLHGMLVEHFKTPGPTQKAINALSDKAKMQELIVKNSLEFYRPRTIVTNIKGITSELENVQFPVVAKVSIGAKSRGVYKLSKRSDFDQISTDLTHYAHDNSHPILIEQFIHGKQVTPLSYVDEHGIFKLISMVDVITAEETGLKNMQLVYRSTPSRYKENVRQKISYIMQKLVTASGLKSICLHPEFKVSGKNVFLIEVNVRVGGFRADMAKNAYNLDLDAITFQLALGLPVNDAINSDQTSTAAEIWEDTSGTIKEFSMPKNKYITHSQQHFKTGDTYTAPPKAHKPLATYFVTHPEDSLRIAKRIRKQTQLVIE